MKYLILIILFILNFELLFFIFIYIVKFIDGTKNLLVNLEHIKNKIKIKMYFLIRCKIISFYNILFKKNIYA